MKKKTTTITLLSALSLGLVLLAGCESEEAQGPAAGAHTEGDGHNHGNERAHGPEDSHKHVEGDGHKHVEGDGHTHDEKPVGAVQPR